MAAAAWADAKNATVAYLDLDYLSPGAIYALGSGRYTDETVERVQDAAALQGAKVRLDRSELGSLHATVAMGARRVNRAVFAAPRIAAQLARATWQS